MKKKLLLSCMTAAMVVGLVPQANTTVQANNNYQGSAFEQGKYDLQAEFPYGENWSENSRYVGSEKKEVKWKFDLGNYIEGRPVIGKDSALYVMTNKVLYAINKDGSLKWQTVAEQRRRGTPVIGEDGTIYATVFTGNSYYLEAYNPDGTLKWKSKSERSHMSTLAIDEEGTIYVNGYSYLEAFNPDGSLKWRVERKGFSGDRNKISISKDGSIHTLLNNGKTSTPSDGARLYTHDKNGVEKWSMHLPAISTSNSFTLGVNGDIYYNAGNEIFIISSDGQLKHKWTTKIKANGAPTISEKDGTIYVAGDDGSLYAYNPDGSIKWSHKISVWITPTLDANGDVYAMTRDNTLAVINSDGTLKSTTNDIKAGFGHAQITIGKDGTIYALSQGTKGHGYALAAIGDPNADETPCTPTKGYLELLEEKIKTNDLTDEEKKEARERLTQVLKSLE